MMTVQSLRLLAYCGHIPVKLKAVFLPVVRDEGLKKRSSKKIRLFVHVVR